MSANQSTTWSWLQPWSERSAWYVASLSTVDSAYWPRCPRLAIAGWMVLFAALGVALLSPAPRAVALPA